MQMQDQPKWVKYAAILAPHLTKVFDEDADVRIDIEDLEDEENLQAFFHALSTVVPCNIFNRIIGDNKNHLEYNHTANILCFKFVNMKKQDNGNQNQ